MTETPKTWTWMLIGYASTPLKEVCKEIDVDGVPHLLVPVQWAERIMELSKKAKKELK